MKKSKICQIAKTGLNENITEVKNRRKKFWKSQSVFIENSWSRNNKQEVWWIAWEETTEINNAGHILKLFMFCDLEKKRKRH